MKKLVPRRPNIYSTAISVIEDERMIDGYYVKRFYYWYRFDGQLFDGFAGTRELAEAIAIRERFKMIEAL
jgi:hypothetical protein